MLITRLGFGHVHQLVTRYSTQPEGGLLMGIPSVNRCRSNYSMRIAIPLCVVCSMFIGCKVSPKWQTVRISVFDLRSNNPVSGVKLTLLLQNPNAIGGYSDQDWMDIFDESATTDMNGTASIDLENRIVLCGSLSNLFDFTDYSRDIITDKLYLMRIQKEQALEMITMHMKCNEYVHSKKYRLTVLHIGKPRRHK